MQSITLALRSYASQQPTDVLGAILKELDLQLDSLQCTRAHIGLPWILSESGEGADNVLSSLPDFDLANEDDVVTESSVVASPNSAI